APVPTGLVVDATVGGGGHAAAVLAARPDVRLLGIDRDADAVDAASARLESFGSRVQVVQGGFEHIADIVRRTSEGDVMGVIFALGVSSPQLAGRHRGFSSWADAPLDMRRDARQSLTAAEVVNEYDEDRLVEVLRDFGEERHARRIAARIVASRPLRTTGDL